MREGLGRGGGFARKANKPKEGGVGVGRGNGAGPGSEADRPMAGERMKRGGDCDSRNYDNDG